MLVLTVGENDKISFGDDITVFVSRRQGKLRLAIDAPKSVKIVRVPAQDEAGDDLKTR